MASSPESIGVKGSLPFLLSSSVEAVAKEFSEKHFCASDLFHLSSNIQERKSSPKSKFWGWISRGRPRGYPGGRPGAKNFGQALKILENKHFGADIHDPKARTSMTPRAFFFFLIRSKKLRAEFSFPKYPQATQDRGQESKNSPQCQKTTLRLKKFSEAPHMKVSSDSHRASGSQPFLLLPISWLKEIPSF